MFKRLSNSLLSPKEVAKYYNEPFWKTLVFFLILLVILMVPTVAGLSTLELLSGDTKKQIQNAFYKEEIPFEIVDGQLVNVNGNTSYVYRNNNISNLHFAFTEKIENVEPSLDVTTLSFCGDGVYIHMGVTHNKVLTYSKFDYLKNLDFSDKDQLMTLNFWDSMFGVANDVIKDIKPVIVTIYSFSYLFQWVITMLMFMLLLAMFDKFRMGNYIKFGKIFKVSTYSLTPLVFCLIFANLFGFGFLRLIGFILTSVFNLLTINELLKDLYLKRKEGE